jgi:hypothetical protein
LQSRKEAPGMSNEPTAQIAHPIMFWVLTLMALAVFAPCVLTPAWVEVQEVRAYEREMAGLIGDLQAQVTRNEAQIQALLADPLVNERIARRELNFQPAGEQVIRWSPEELAALRVPTSALAMETPLTQEPPHWVQVVGKWLPAWPWHELFVKTTNRTLLLAMAGGLLSAAFLLFGRTTRVNVEAA